VPNKQGIITITDIVRGKWSPRNVELIAQQVAENDGLYTRHVLEQEPGQAGKAQIERWQKDVLKDYTVHAVRPSGEKKVRNQILASEAEAGHIQLLRAPWNETVLNEIALFPFGLNDDTVDAIVYALVDVKSKRQVEWDIF
jgi:predicted phage terminase large subunit-like protein